MKTLATSLLIAASLTISATGFAQDTHSVTTPQKTPMTIQPTQSGKIDVVIGKTDGHLSIDVVDQQGRTLSHKAVYKQDSNSRIRFDLSELPDGVYQLIVTEGTSRQTNAIVLNTQTSDTYRTITLS
ncbi:T9SS type A sorting domain-containing protein [Spirosoma pulveris]